LINKIDEDYEKMKKLSQVLDNNALNGRLNFILKISKCYFFILSEVPKLIEQLRQVSDKQSTLEVS
jgi:hypothetical protein